MKFVRNKVIAGVRDGKPIMKRVAEDLKPVVQEVSAQDVKSVAQSVEIVPPVHPPVKDVFVAEPVDTVPEKVEDVKVVEEPVVSMEEKFKIPVFERKSQQKAAGVAYSAPVSKKEVEPVVQVMGKDIKSVEAVDEVPADAVVAEGVEIVGDVAPEVEAQIEKIAEKPTVAVSPLPTKGSSAVPPTKTARVATVEAPKLTADAISNAPKPTYELHLPEGTIFVNDIEDDPDVVPPPFIKPAPVKVEEDSKVEKVEDISKFEEASADIKDTAEMAWNKFIDCVIVPTLNTCLDKAKEYVSTVLAAELKKSNPDE